MSTITLTPVPVDRDRHSFLVDPPVTFGESGHFDKNGNGNPPFVAALLSVPGIRGVELAEGSFTVTRDPDAEWIDLDERIRYTVETTITQLANAVRATGEFGEMDDDGMYDLVAEIFEREVNPNVAKHGGKVELIDVQDAMVIVRMQGGCQGCGMASVTLRQGIEGSLKRAIPGLRGIEDVTDHAAGTNPYFAPEKTQG